MDPKKMLSKELACKVKGHISEEDVSETVDQFFKHGSTFLLSELISLQSEVKRLREELEHKRNKRERSLRAMIVP